TDGLMDPDIETGEKSPRIPDICYRPSRLNRPIPSLNLSRVGSKMRMYGQGIIAFPPTPSHTVPQPLLTTYLPSLPPVNLADHLFTQYFSYVHSVLPILHWDSLMKDYDRVCKAGSFRGVPRAWVAVLFAVLACGSLHTLDPDMIAEGQEYLTKSISLIDLWPDRFSMDQARAALLVSIYLYEKNRRSSSWVWVGLAVRIAQDLELHIESGLWPPFDAESRRRLWWALYAWERFVSRKHYDDRILTVT